MTYVQTNFTTYNHIARWVSFQLQLSARLVNLVLTRGVVFHRYLSTRVLPLQGKKSRTALKRMAKRFDVIGEGLQDHGSEVVLDPQLTELLLVFQTGF